MKSRISLLAVACITAGLFCACSPDLEQLERQAEQGDVEAQVELALAYAQRNKDLNETEHWIVKAANQGGPVYQKALNQIMEDALNGDQDAYHALFLWFNIVPKDKSKALHAALEGFMWNSLHVKAEQGDADAQREFGSLYEDGGYGVDKDPRQAVKWYRKAAEQGHAGGQVELGRCYEEGIGVDKDPREAVTWYRKAAEQGYSDGQKHLGDCYRAGIGVDKDPLLAVKWYRKAAEQDHPLAKKALQELGEK